MAWRPVCRPVWEQPAAPRLDRAGQPRAASGVEAGRPATAPGSGERVLCPRRGRGRSELAWASPGSCFLRTCWSDRADALVGKKPWIGVEGAQCAGADRLQGKGGGEAAPSTSLAPYPVPFCWLGGGLAVTRGSCPRPARLGRILPLLPACSHDSGCAKKPHR